MYKLVLRQWIEEEVDPATGEITSEAHWETSAGKELKATPKELLEHYADKIVAGSACGCSFFVKECGEGKNGKFALD